MAEPKRIERMAREAQKKCPWLADITASNLARAADAASGADKLAEALRKIQNPSNWSAYPAVDSKSAEMREKIIVEMMTIASVALAEWEET